MGLLIVFWHLMLSRLSVGAAEGTAGGAGSSAAHPDGGDFRRLHRIVAVMSVAGLVGLVAVGSLAMPLILWRWGWGGAP